MGRLLAWATVVLLAGGAAVGAGSKTESGKPRLDLRANPRMALPPVDVLLVAELKGGGAIEEYYCPGLEWDWGDGSRSAEESDCPPFEAGAEVQRFYTARHAYGTPGNYQVKLTMRRASRTVAVAEVPVIVFGDNNTPK